MGRMAWACIVLGRSLLLSRRILMMRICEGGGQKEMAGGDGIDIDCAAVLYWIVTITKACIDGEQ